MIAITVVNQVFVEQGIPNTVHRWVVFVGGITTGIGLRLAKDANVSNSPHSTSISHIVPKE